MMRLREMQSVLARPCRCAGALKIVTAGGPNRVGGNSNSFIAFFFQRLTPRHFLNSLQTSPATCIGSWFHGTITQRLGSSNAPNLQMRGKGLSYARRNDQDVSTSSTSNIDVLIVGAGPTGLVLALWLTQMGVRVRVVDEAAQPGTTSRALAVQARTLELYRQVGLADAVVARGRRVLAVNLWVSGKKAAHAVLGAMGEGISPFPYALVYPQDEHERLLIDRLSEFSVQVERRMKFVEFEDRGEHTLARLKGPDGDVETCEARYIAGCDGANST